jgi:hypothetical protein
MVINSTNINKTNYHHSTELTEHKNTMTYGVGNPGPVIPIFITGFPTAIHILVNDEKHVHICFHSQRSHNITKKNDNMNMDNTIARSMNARS